MPARQPRLQVTDDGFATIMLLDLVYSPTAPDQLVGWMLDGTVMTTGPDVLATLEGVLADFVEYKADDLDGDEDPREDGLGTPHGGPRITRSARDAQGKSTFTIVGRPSPYRESLCFELKAALPAFIAAQRPPAP